MSFGVASGLENPDLLLGVDRVRYRTALGDPGRAP